MRRRTPRWTGQAARRSRPTPARWTRWISGAEARDYVHWLRAGFDAIATGGRTAAQDDPSLTVRGAITPRLQPRRVIFDRALGLSPSSVLVRTAGETPTLAVTAPAAVGSARAETLRAAGVQVLGAASLDDAMTALRAAGVTSMLVEGGGRLAGALLDAGLVDRYYWIQSPLLLGQGGVPAFAGVPDAALAGAPRWTVAERRALGEDTLALDQNAIVFDSGVNHAVRHTGNQGADFAIVQI